MAGEYKEKLSYSNGDLIVTKDSWRISYYFAGPDLRHNGTFFSIDGKKIDEYIDAYKKNWNKYCELKKIQAGMSGEIKVNGDLNMTINVGGYFNGICINTYHMPINSEENLNNLIDSFTWAKKRAVDVMRILKEIG